MKHQFNGTGVALVTPFQTNGSIDFPALEKLINGVIHGGVNYLVALGTTAETPTLSAEEKRDVVEFILAQAKGRIPVVCGIGGNHTLEVIDQINQYAFVDQLAGILTVVPYYNKPSQEGIFQHFDAIAKSTDKPLILYNVPGRTATNMTAETSLTLARAHQHVVAIKEASGNLAQCMDLVQGKPDHFAVLSGDDDLVLPQIALGMDGVISVAANCFSKSFSDMVSAALNQNWDQARKIHYQLLEGIRLLFAEGNPAGVKSVLSHQNTLENILRLPMIPVSSELDHRIGKFLQKLG